jgi:hypothetical protein
MNTIWSRHGTEDFLGQHADSGLERAYRQKVLDPDG